MQILPETLDKHYDILLDNESELNTLNPRDYLSYRIGFADVYECLNLLLEKNPVSIADIGCGTNYYKKFIPHLTGVDPEFEQADIQAGFDAEFSKQYTHSFDAAFSICALHFIPLYYMRTRILEFANIIKPGGRGYIALNLARMVEDAPYKKNTRYLVEMFGTETPSITQCKDYVTKELDMLDLDVLQCNIDLESYDAYYNGNIRLFFNT